MGKFIRNKTFGSDKVIRGFHAICVHDANMCEKNRKKVYTFRFV